MCLLKYSIVDASQLEFKTVQCYYIQEKYENEIVG